MEFALDAGNGTVVPDMVIVAGFTGRDRGAVMAHIAELEAEGIRCPETVPVFYRFPPWILTTDERIRVAGDNTSGEAEIALVVIGSQRYLTLASDHTDRDLESVDIWASKHVCPKILAPELWSLESVIDHWDQLRLRSWIADGVPYQDGTAAELLPPLDLLDRLDGSDRPESFVMLCGTVPAIGGIRPSSHFGAALEDPISGRTIAMAYDVEVLGREPGSR